MKQGIILFDFEAQNCIVAYFSNTFCFCFKSSIVYWSYTICFVLKVSICKNKKKLLKYNLKKKNQENTVERNK